MNHDHSGEEPGQTEQTHTAEGNVSESAPLGAKPDEHGHDVHEHDVHEHDGHGEDASEQSTLVPVTWRQLIFPALIVLIVIILLIGPVSGAFAPKPAPPGSAPIPTAQPTATPASTPSGAKPQNAVAGVQEPPQVVAFDPPTQTPRPTQHPQDTPTPGSGPGAVSASAAATRTAVATLGENGQIARAPVQLQFEGAQFTVDPGSGILPDWKPSGDASHATWIQGTYANHIIYLQYSDGNAALFNQVKTGDVVRLTMDNGQVFEFQVTRSERALNGPPTAKGQFTVTTAMNQDHAGVTIFLIGDPAPNRAVVQADFDGNIE